MKKEEKNKEEEFPVWVNSSSWAGGFEKYPLTPSEAFLPQDEKSQLDLLLTQEVNEESDVVFDAMLEVMDYHDSTLEDKYEGVEGNSNMSQIMSDAHGKSINTFSASKYINRYMTEGFEKSDDRKDIVKAIHYLLFELARTAE